MNQPPAGTRGVFNLLTAARQMAVTPYAFLVPADVVTAIGTMKANTELMQQHGIYCHVGRVYLTGGAPEPQAVVDLSILQEEPVNWIGHYVHIVRGNSSFAKSKGHPAQTEGHIAETQIRALKR
eukprot:5036085-Amphidinium_carterae.1